jgi:hypothetical protein
MSAGRRTALAAVLMTCAVLATTASAARAQMGEDVPPHAVTLAPPADPVPPASLTSSFDLGSFRLGLPLQFGASLAAYRWLAPLRSQMAARRAPGVTSTQHFAVRSAWWRKRI